MELSTFSQKFTGESGILQLMADLGSAASEDGVIMLGGGNPSMIPQLQDYFRQRMAHILDSENEFERLIGTYAAPGGEQRFVAALVELLRKTYGWDIGPQNVALTNGSQTAFFFLFNLFGGEFPQGRRKRILLPLTPEYIGYEDVGLTADLFVANKPEIDLLGERIFKYRIDFAAVEVTADIGAICVSRPTNPTGNVLTADEVDHLSALARQHEIPLIIDNAYGLPFPAIIFSEAQPTWEPHIVLCMSLSKLGLPGARTGIVIAAEPIIQALTGLNAVISLAPGNFGAALALEAVRTSEILRLSREVIRPHYEAKARAAVAWFKEELDDTDFYIHKPEGAIFLWLWFKGLPISAQELYLRLKARRVLVIPGHHFFPGLAEPWQHRHECIRVNYAMDEATVRTGVKMIAAEVKRAYAKGRG